MTATIPTIRRTGILFRPGAYGAKGTYTDADMDAMASDTPVPINIEHRPSPLDNKLGQCVRRFAGYDDNGKKVLMGEWDEPLPLAQLLGDGPRKPSVEVNLETKQVTAVALTTNPHITDAAFFSAVENAYAQFSRGETVTPLSAIKETSMSTETAAVAATAENQKGFMERLVEWFKGAKPEEIAAFSALAPTAGAATPDPEKEALKAQVAAFTANQVTQRAASAKEMAEKLLVENRIVPAQLDAVTAEFSRALDDDAATPKTVTFSVDDGNGAKDVAMSRAACLQAHYEAREAHSLTGEKVQEFPPETIAAFNKAATQMRNADETTVDEKQVAEFLAQTSAGRVALAARQANGQAASNGVAAK